MVKSRSRVPAKSRTAKPTLPVAEVTAAPPKKRYTAGSRGEQSVFLPTTLIERVKQVISVISKRRGGERVTQKAAVNYLVVLALEGGIEAEVKADQEAAAAKAGATVSAPEEMQPGSRRR